MQIAPLSPTYNSPTEEISVLKKRSDNPNNEQPDPKRKIISLDLNELSSNAFEILPFELIVNIMKYLPEKDLIHFALTSKMVFKWVYNGKIPETTIIFKKRFFHDVLEGNYPSVKGFVDDCGINPEGEFEINPEDDCGIYLEYNGIKPKHKKYQAILAAARNGHFEILKFFYSKEKEWTTTTKLDILNYVIIKSDLEVFKYFFDQTTIMKNLSIRQFFFFVIQKKCLEILKFLSDREELTLINNINDLIPLALVDSDHEIIKFLCYRKGIELNRENILKVMEFGIYHDLEIFKYFFDQASIMEKIDVAYLFVYAIKSNHLEILTCLSDRAELTLINNINFLIPYALWYKNHEIIKFLCYRKEVELNGENLLMVMTFGLSYDLEIFKYFFDQDSIMEKIDVPRLFFKVIICNRFEILKCLSDRAELTLINNINHLISYAFMGNNHEIIKFLCYRKGIELNRENILKVMEFGIYHDLEIFKYFFDKVDPENMEKLFWIAIDENDLEVMKFFVKKIYLNEEVFFEGLEMITERGNVELLKFLLDKENVFTEDEFKMDEDDVNRLVFIATLYGHLEIIESLFEHTGMGQDKKNIFSAIRYAINHSDVNGYRDYPKVLKFLFDNNRIVIEEDFDEILDIILISAEKCKFKVLKFLLEKVKLKQEEMDRILILSIENTHEKAIPFLLNNFSFNSSYPVISLASKLDSLEIVKLLLKDGRFDPDLPLEGHSPLEYAAKALNLEMVKLFLADPRVKPEHSKRTISLCILSSMPRGEFELFYYNQRLKNQHEILKLLLKDGRSDPGTAIRDACISGNEGGVHLLLDDPRVNALEVDSTGFSPLNMAQFRGFPNIVAIIQKKYISELENLIS